MQSGEYGWVIVRSEPNRESTGCAGLVAHGVKAYLPQIKVQQKPRRGAVRSALRPMFVGYLFSWCCPSDPLWRRLYTSPGLRGPLRLGDMMAVLTQDQMEAIKNKESELLNQKPEQKLKFKKGDVVRLADGSPFTGQLASIEHLDDEQRIVILLNLFGRTTRTRVTQNQIERV